MRVERHAWVEVEYEDERRGWRSWQRTSFSAVSDGARLLQVALRKSTTYRGRFGTSGPWTEFTTGAQATFPIPEILGTYPTTGA